MKIICEIFSKIFFYMLAGYVLGKIKYTPIKKTLQLLTGFITYFVVPVFIVTSVWSINTGVMPVLKLSAVAVSVVFSGMVFTGIFSRIHSMAFRDACLPIMFMNSAFMAIPLNTLLFGREGTVYSIVYNTVALLLLFTLGIYLVSRRNGLQQVLKMPIIYAAAAGLLLNLQGVPVPASVLKIDEALKRRKTGACFFGVFIQVRVRFYGFGAPGGTVFNERRHGRRGGDIFHNACGSVYIYDSVKV